MKGVERMINDDAGYSNFSPFFPIHVTLLVLSVIESIKMQSFAEVESSVAKEIVTRPRMITGTLDQYRPIEKTKYPETLIKEEA